MSLSVDLAVGISEDKKAVWSGAQGLRMPEEEVMRHGGGVMHLTA